MTWQEWVTEELSEIRVADRWREPRILDAAGPLGVLSDDGSEIVSFASNDYLGLSQHTSVLAAAHDAIERWGSGSTASRLVVGSRPVHAELELALAEWKKTEKAVLFPTGYMANLGVLSTLGEPGVLICSDERNHASIVDGARLAKANGAEVRVYPHGEVDVVSLWLGEAASSSRRALVVTDTVFSMDGDLAPVDALERTCAENGALLILDEAHGVLDPAFPLTDATVLRVGTLSKTLGSLGGFVAAPVTFADLLVNRARTYIFTTALSPADAAAALTALDVLRSSQGDELKAALRDRIDQLVPGHPSPIIPIICGDEQTALSASEHLLKLGMLVPAIRPPTVAPGTSRLRVALSALHSSAQVSALAAVLEEIVPGELARLGEGER